VRDRSVVATWLVQPNLYAGQHNFTVYLYDWTQSTSPGTLIATHPFTVTTSDSGAVLSVNNSAGQPDLYAGVAAGPRSHVLDKLPGQELRINWSHSNIGNAGATVNLVLYEEADILAHGPGRPILPGQTQDATLVYTLPANFAGGIHYMAVQMQHATPTGNFPIDGIHYFRIVVASAGSLLVPNHDPIYPLLY
jgi:hypothetical protein